MLLVVTGLGLGLGLGLTQGKSNHPLEPLTTLRPQTTSYVPTSSSLYSSRASETPLPVLKQRILDDTSIGAVALPNGNRWLFFQDITGAIRHATFSAKAGVWQSSIKLEIISDAKNHTPLAVTNIYSPDVSNRLTKLLSGMRLNPLQTLELIYVSTKSSTLRSVSFYHGSIQKTDLYVHLELPDIKVAPNSRRLSAVAVSPNTDVPGILLFYENPTRKLNIMYGFDDLNANLKPWRWRNLTHQISSLILDAWRGYQITAPCCAHWEDLSDDEDERVSFIYCSANNEDVSSALAQAYFSTSTRGNITIREGKLIHSFIIEYAADTLIDTDLADMDDSAATDLIFLHGDVMAWFNKTSLVMNGAPLPTSSFPYKHLAGTSKVNTTESYIYHQLNETTIAEEYWDGGRSDFWITRNITIDAG